MKNTFKTSRVWAALYFLLLLGLNYLLFFGRKQENLRITFFEKLMPSFYSHISNFTLSSIFILIIGYLWILQGVKFRKIIWLAAVIVAANFVYELLLPFLNTKDVVDAYFGLAGSILSIILLIPIALYGIEPNSEKTKK